MTNYLIDNGDDTMSGSLTANNFILASDRREKMYIHLIPDEPYRVDFVQFERIDSPGELRYGVIAQELAALHPEMVLGNELDRYTVKYIDVIIRKLAEFEFRLNKLEGK